MSLITTAVTAEEVAAKISNVKSTLSLSTGILGDLLPFFESFGESVLKSAATQVITEVESEIASLKAKYLTPSSGSL